MGTNLWDYYSHQNLLDLLDYKQRIEIIRWLKKCARNGYPIRLFYMCPHDGSRRRPIQRVLYLRKDVDAWFEYATTLSEDPLYRWTIAKRQYRLRRIDLDLDEWIPYCRVVELWYVHDTPDVLYKGSRTRAAFVSVRSRWVDFGRGSRQLFFKKADVIALQERMASYARNKV